MPAERKPKVWMGSMTCDFHNCDLSNVEFFVDGKTKMGPWALMCPGAFYEHGVGIGPGQGQQYNGKTREKIDG